jgi:hypothetical protein
MLEKIKDILYDLTDFALVILIIVIMTTVISIKITDAMSVNLFSFFNNEETTETAVVDEPEEPIKEDDDVEEIIIKPEFDESIENQENEANENDESNENNNATENTSVEANKEVTIVIESGSTGYAIAKKLRDNELIEDTSVFISRVEDLELGASLQSGTFVLNTSQTLDDMIYTLAGQR